MFTTIIHQLFLTILIKNPLTDGKCEDNDLNQDEDEDVHVCGSCKSAFGNVGA